MQNIAENANLGYTKFVNKRQKDSLIIMSIMGAPLLLALVVTLATI